ncbi:hypothetical protein FB451DRAFT_1178087 [Mycena latifolia]|nr:hypothetical protein FB451DRAFT_1178087 [Mycena latifolia]
MAHILYATPRGDGGPTTAARRAKHENTRRGVGALDDTRGARYDCVGAHRGPPGRGGWAALKRRSHLAAAALEQVRVSGSGGGIKWWDADEGLYRGGAAVEGGTQPIGDVRSEAKGRELKTTQELQLLVAGRPTRLVRSAIIFRGRGKASDGMAERGGFPYGRSAKHRPGMDCWDAVAGCRSLWRIPDGAGVGGNVGRLGGRLSARGGAEGPSGRRGSA